MTKGKEIQTMSLDENSVKRLWTYLEELDKDVKSVNSKLDTLIRVEEQVKSHSDTLKRFGDRMDNHGKRLKEVELWKAGNESIIESISKIEEDVETLLNKQSISEGRKEIMTPIIRWIGVIGSGIITALVLYIFIGT